MKFFQIILPIIALCVGLVVWSETSSPKRSSLEPVTNSPAVSEDGPTARNLLAALGIAVGGSGGMQSIGSTNDARLVTDPERTRREAFYGWEVKHPGMTGPNDSIHLVQSALSGVPMKPVLERPASLTTLPSAENCVAPEVQANQKLAKVHVFEGQMETGYHAVTDRMLAEGAKAYIRDLQQAKDPAKETPPSKTRPVPVVNVVLTDDSAPLYLVLQASARQVLWNLHATPNVVVEQIVLVGNPGQAVHPLTPETPVTMLNIGADCAPQPWRDTSAYWEKYPNRAAESGDYAEKAAGYHSRYNDWFLSTFGQPAERGTVGAWVASHVLVGPLPPSAEKRATYRPLTGSTIVAHEGPVLYVAPRRERELDVAARRHALALAAAGGDLGIINPTPMERAQ